MPPKTVICLTSDLMMSGKINSLCRSQRLDCIVSADADQAWAKLPPSSDCLWLIDLQRNRDDLQALLGPIRTAGQQAIGYAQHVRPELLERAREAGMSSVMTRGQLDHRVPKLLAEFAEPTESDPRD